MKKPAVAGFFISAIDPLPIERAAANAKPEPQSSQGPKRRSASKAELRRATVGVDTAKSLVTQREAEKKSAVAVAVQCDTADRKLQRSTQLIRTNAVPQQ